MVGGAVTAEGRMKQVRVPPRPVSHNGDTIDFVYLIAAMPGRTVVIKFTKPRKIPRHFFNLLLAGRAERVPVHGTRCQQSHGPHARGQGQHPDTCHTLRLELRLERDLGLCSSVFCHLPTLRLGRGIGLRPSVLPRTNVMLWGVTRQHGGRHSN